MRVNYISLLLFGIIYFQLNGFYLPDRNQFPVQFQDMAIFLEILFWIVIYTKRDEQAETAYSKRTKWLFIMPVLLGCTSALMGYVRYLQPFFMGLRAQRAWIAAMLMYFPVSRAIRTGRYSIERLLGLIDKINAIYFLLLLMQYIIGGRYLFLHVSVDQRYGAIRLYASTSFMLISYGLHLWKLLKSDHIKFADVFFVGATLFTYFLITKSRMGMVALIGATAIVVLRQKFTEKKLIILSIIVVAICVFLSTDAGSEILKLAFGAEITTSGNDTSLIREIGRTFYISEVMSSLKTFIFGCGYINSDWAPTVRATRMSENIFVVDNGMFGLVFMYGILFLCWATALYYRYIREAFKSKNDFGVFMFLIGVLGCYSLYPECYRACMAFPLTCVIFEEMCHRSEQEEVLT